MGVGTSTGFVVSFTESCDVQGWGVVMMTIFNKNKSQLSTKEKWFSCAFRCHSSDNMRGLFSNPCGVNEKAQHGAKERTKKW